jgi:hypothetical protein
LRGAENFERHTGDTYTYVLGLVGGALERVSGGGREGGMEGGVSTTALNQCSASIFLFTWSPSATAHAVDGF